MSRMRMVTTEYAGRDFSSEGADPNVDSAWAIVVVFSARVMMRRNGIVKKRKLRELFCVVRTLVMGPRLLDLASLSHKCSQGKSRRKKRCKVRPRPFLFHESMTYWIAANISLIWGVFNFLSAFASIWRIRSLVTERLCPTCSSVQA